MALISVCTDHIVAPSDVTYSIVYTVVAALDWLTVS